MDRRTDDGRSLRWFDLALIAAASAYAPLSIVAANISGIPHPERLLALVLLLSTAGAVLSWVLIRLGVPRGPAVHSLFVGILLMMGGGSLLRRLGWLGPPAALGTVLFVAFMSFRLRQRQIVNALIAVLAVTVLSGPLIDVYRSWSRVSVDPLGEANPQGVDMSERPDVFLIVTDGYPGSSAFEQDFGSANRELEDALEARGFQIPSSAWTSYWVTPLAIAGMLTMDYPLAVEGESLDRRKLYHEIGGANSLVATLKSNGYHTYMVESGWSGSDCSSVHYDVCVASPLVDEAMFKTLEQSVWWSWTLEATGGPFVAGARRSMEWLLENAPSVTQSDKPTFLFAHLVVPHPPFFLDEQCELSVEPARSSVTFYRDGVTLQERSSYFLEQVACVDGFLIELADRLEPDDVLVYVSDHGTDRRAQLTLPGSEWSQEAIVERMNVLAAVRMPGECAVGDNLVTVNMMRRVIGCYTSSTVSDLPSRMWLQDMYEVEPSAVARLVDGEMSLGR